MVIVKTVARWALIIGVIVLLNVVAYWWLGPSGGPACKPTMGGDEICDE